MPTSNDTTNLSVAFVVFDIGKNVHALAAYAGHDLRPILSPEFLRATPDGFARATAVIDALLASGDYDCIVLGHEPTGVYHETWGHALCDRYAAALRPDAHPRLVYRFLNPFQTKQDRKRVLGRNRKSDFTDLAAIARCLSDGAGTPAFLPTAQDIVFQHWAAAYFHTVRDLRRLTRQLLSAFDRLWPGALVDVPRFQRAHPRLSPPVPLVRSKPLERKLVRALIRHAPNPHLIRDMSPDDLLAFLRTHVGRASPATAQRVLACAQHALLPPPDVAAVLAACLQRDFDLYLTLEARLLALSAEAEQLVPASPAAVLTSLPGLSPCLAARYLAGVGRPDRFSSPNQVWALAGFDPLPSDSGDTRRTGPISRKGDPAFRDTLFMIGVHTARFCPPIAQAKARALARGLSPVGATLHAAHKANRLCWRLLRDQRPYDPHRLA